MPFCRCSVRDCRRVMRPKTTLINPDCPPKPQTQCRANGRDTYRKHFPLLSRFWQNLVPVVETCSWNIALNPNARTLNLVPVVETCSWNISPISQPANQQTLKGRAGESILLISLFSIHASMHPWHTGNPWFRLFFRLTDTEGIQIPGAGN